MICTCWVCIDNDIIVSLRPTIHIGADLSPEHDESRAQE